MSDTNIHYNSFCFPVQGSENGCGVQVGDMFITAGHVIMESDKPFIFVNGEKLFLDKTRMIACYDEFETGGLDVAIFKVPELSSSLILSSHIPTNGDILKSISFKMSASGYDRIECDVTVGNCREGHYYGATTNVNLKAGSSGSPVIIGNEIVGILCRGNNNDLDEQIDFEFPINFCVFLSSKSLLELINR